LFKKAVNIFSDVTATNYSNTKLIIKDIFFFFDILESLNELFAWKLKKMKGDKGGLLISRDGLMENKGRVLRSYMSE